LGDIVGGTDPTLLNGDFALWTDPTVPDDWTKIGTHDVNNYLEQSPAGVCRIVSAGTFMGVGTTGGITTRKLYKNVFTLSFVTGGINVVYASTGLAFPYTAAGTYTKYITPLSNYNPYYSRIGVTDAGVDNVSIQQVTDCAATGALIVSTLGGATRSWTSVDTGFNPNLACELKIFRVR
jgi:hypothetical protein